MKKIVITVMITFIGIKTQAQQSQSREAYHQDIRFNQYLEKITSEEKKLSYKDIDGSPYYKSEFLPARFGNSSVIKPIRYNCYTDTVELLNGDNIDEIPKQNIVKNSDLSKFTFEKSHETLILVDTHDELSGYFFSIVTGENLLLKKVTVKFKPQVAAPNHLIPGSPPKFEKPITTYYIKTAEEFFKVPENVKGLLYYFPEDKDKIRNFIKKDKIKLSRETDLTKLVAFLNTN